MKKITLYIILFLGLTNPLMAGDTLKVLFIGNSYTFVNDLPALLSNMAGSAGDTVIYSSNCPGGYTLKLHFSNSQTISLIQQGGWDYVVLQEQSQWPSAPMNMVQSEVLPFARGLDSLITLYNDCAETVFYRTWGRKNGDQQNCASWPPVCTYAGMDSLLNERYRLMADSNNAILSPVGNAWKYVRENYPGIELYSPDESHPSEAGSYLAACCFYTVMFRKDPVLIAYDFSLDSTTAARIRYAVSQTVFNDLNYWNVGKFDPLASFTYSASANQVSFASTSQNALYYRWNFGDGNVSTLPAPVHQYSGSGAYTVRLTAGRCDREDSTETDVIVTLTGISGNERDRVEVYPLPAKDYVMVRSARFENKSCVVTLIDCLGKESLLQTHGDLKERRIPLVNIPPGIYFLKVSISEEPELRVKFLIR